MPVESLAVFYRVAAIVLPPLVWALAYRLAWESRLRRERIPERSDRVVLGRDASGGFTARPQPGDEWGTERAKR